MFRSTKRTACLYKDKSAEKVPSGKAANSTRSAGESNISKPPSAISAADSQKDKSAKSQPKEKFEQDASVYDSNEKDGNGRLKGNKGTRYWICCVEWDPKKKRWFYMLKDAPYPNGRDVRWVEERYLHEWHV